MTTAKPQQMVGQADSADDLIAELAKLMAQDSQAEPARRPAPQPSQPQTQPAPAAVRIPGMNTAPAAPQPAEPRLEANEPKAEAKPDPFSFDFGLSPPKREPAPVAPTVQPAPTAQAAPTVQAAPVPQQAPVVTPTISAAPTVSAGPAASADVHDTIADLIAAELNATPEPARTAPAPQPQAATPSRPQPEEPAFAPTVSLRPAAPVSRIQPEPNKPALRPVNLTPVARPEGDKFRIAPVFGLGTTPPAAANSTAPVAAEPARVEPKLAMPQAPTPAPAVEPTIAPVASAAPLAQDPIEEIENLIGRAVRVDLDKAPERPAPSPALRSLATPIVAEPAASKLETERMVTSADEAILAAAAATGAEVGWVNPGDASRKQSKAAPRQQRRRSRFGAMRAVLGPLVAVCLLLVAGFGLYWVLGLGRADGPAPVLVADTSPIKQAVAPQPDPAQAQQSVVFNEIEGVVPGAEEQLVSRDQADVNEVTRIVTPDVNEEGIANRKVRTVTVRPDGSIVSGDDALAGSAMLPVDRPTVPAVPGADTASPELLASASALQAPAAAAAPVTPAAPTVIPVVPGSNVPVVDTAGNPVAGRIAPVPYQRPASIGNAPPSGGAASPVNAVVDPIGAILQPVNAAAQSTVQAATGQSPQMALAPSPAPAAPAAAPAASNAAAYAQLSSQRSEADARATLDLLNRRYGLLFNGAQLQIQRADLGARGVYYRVVLPASSRSAAADICTSVKSTGDECFVM